MLAKVHAAKGLVIWAAVALLAFAAGGAEAETKSTLSDKDKAAVEAVVRDYLKENPEVILEALKALEAKERAARMESAREAIAAEQKALKHDPASYVGGNPKGDVTIVEFFDYNCGYCRTVAPAIQSLLADDKNLRLVLKEWPIRGADSIAVTQVSLAASKQPKFLAFHFALLAEEGHVNEATALAVARKVGLNMDRLQKDMKAMNALEVIQRTDALAGKIGIDGTPGFVVGTTLVPGAVSAERLKTLIAETRRDCKQASC